MPERIQFAYGHSTSYLYDASGVKRQVAHDVAKNNLNIPMGTTENTLAYQDMLYMLTTDYFGNKVYENGELKYILNPDGYILCGEDVNRQRTYDFHYYLKDHLGNIRKVLSPEGGALEAIYKPEQENNYYASGLLQPNSFGSEVQPYKFGGKELDEVAGLNWYDFHARQRDAIIPMFTTMDPMAEKYYNVSPYAYCNNNPVNYIDPDGRDDYSVNWQGHIELIKKTEDEVDKLIALGKNDKIVYDSDGNMTNSSFDVKKGILDNQKKSDKTTYMSVSGNEQAERMFKFLSENTGVEWGRLSYGKSSNYLSTNNDAYDNGIETIAYNKLLKDGKANLIKSIDHSHPNATLPSGFPSVKGLLPKGQGDKAFAEWMYEYFPMDAPSIKLRVYNPVQKTYIQYNNKRILTK